MHARIENGRVREVVGFDPAGKFNPALVWVECDETVQVGDTHDGQVFGPPPGPTAEEIAAQAAAVAAQEDIDAAKQFARLAALKALRPAEVSGYITARYPAPAGNLAEANAILTKMRDDIETLAIAVAILARRL